MLDKPPHASVTVWRRFGTDSSNSDRIDCSARILAQRSCKALQTITCLMNRCSVLCFRQSDKSVGVALGSALRLRLWRGRGSNVELVTNRSVID